MNKIYVTVMDLLMFTTIAGLALDIVKWTVTDEMGDASQNMIIRLIEAISEIPIKILDKAIELVFKVIESVVKMVVGLVAGKDAADSIKFT